MSPFQQGRAGCLITIRKQAVCARTLLFSALRPRPANGGRKRKNRGKGLFGSPGKLLGKNFSENRKKHLLFSASCAIISRRLRVWYAPVAQLDRVTGYEPVGRGFESLPAYQEKNRHPCGVCSFFLILSKESVRQKKPGSATGGAEWAGSSKELRRYLNGDNSRNRICTEL